jgi:hypothetical protein
MMKKLKESSFGANLLNTMNTEMNKASSNLDLTNSSAMAEFSDTKDSLKKGIDEDEKIKNKKMNKPIGKLYTLTKKEFEEAATSGGSGGYSTKLFGGEMKEKWSQKYKDSIDCDNPKGFSQRAHCQGKVKKTETKEATSSSSVGAYDAPGFEDVKMKGNHPKGRGRSFKKTQLPGGKFVKVKDKCKKFPYCNQGDIKALILTNEGKIHDIISHLSEKYNISEDLIRTWVINDYNKRK